MKAGKRNQRHVFWLKLIGVLIAVAALNLAPRVNALTWSEVLERARGQTVDWFMWGGFPSTNAYVNGYVAPRVKELYGIKLRQVPIKDISEVISKILVEKQAGKNEDGEIDLYIGTADISTRCGFDSEEWESFVEHINKANERYLELKHKINV